MSRDIYGVRMKLYEENPRGMPGKFDLPGGITILPFQFTITRVEARPRRMFESDDVELKIVAMVRDRDTGAPIEITFGYVANEHEWAEYPREVVRKAIINMLVHEVDELLLLDGQRDDPHKERGGL